MAKIVLTGATGFVGSFVAEKLIEDQHEVICLIRKTSNLKWLEKLPVRLVVASLFDPETYKDVLRNADCILHVAGVTKAEDPADYYRGNVQTTKLLLDTVLEVNPSLSKFLLVSSQAAVGPSPDEMPIDESYPSRPLTDYGKSKLLAENLARTYMSRLPITIVRPPSVYGPRDTDVYIFFKNLKKGWNVQVGDTDQLVSLVYVEDLARGIIQAAISERSSSKTYFLCEEPAYYWSHVAEIAAGIMNRNYRTIKIPLLAAKGVAGILEVISKLRKRPTILNRQKILEIQQPYWAISSRRAQTDFHYHTGFALPDGIARTIEWYQHACWL
ncbi:MAG: NAD(P)-dependent oxidoreductase [Calditrichia bacterium]